MVTPNEVRSLKDGEHTESQSLGHSETRVPGSALTSSCGGRVDMGSH